MAKNANVPQFGKWENEGSVPYTQYFENARKGKNAARMINPNDPLENPEAFYTDDPPIHASPSRAAAKLGTERMKHERCSSGEEVTETQVVNYRSTEPTSIQKRISGSPNRWQNQGDNQRRTSRHNGGSEHSIEHSPVHHPHIRSASKGGVYSPSKERRTSSEKHRLAPNTPGRSKTKLGDCSDNVIDKCSAVPKFGDWNVSDPTSGDGYSYIFGQVREEKHSGSNNIPSISREQSSGSPRRKTNSESVNICCFCFKK
ncbi:hypothetical protein HPP92_020221 [Vanilla planifolia]|uniref:RIN4 pathogenic type III effector avirulence factor Avr cleavage site domain-containing protein n=1 Tax=Vanilla planifolia TaxID=51239 RepID=A0A835UJN3_VANPL|nr:hypothetical protein HPP92_020221 [Vanilla planifolia]